MKHQVVRRAIKSLVKSFYHSFNRHRKRNNRLVIRGVEISFVRRRQKKRLVRKPGRIWRQRQNIPLFKNKPFAGFYLMIGDLAIGAYTVFNKSLLRSGQLFGHHAGDDRHTDDL